MPATRAPRTDGRLQSLDGLRGLAALTVLLHHCLLTVPGLAAVYFATDAPSPLGHLGWALSYTPLHLVWAGGEAVFLFFVLSGLVLVLPALRRPDTGWLAYYPRRVVRLYGPVLVAVALGALSYALAPRVNAADLGPWVNGRPNSYPLAALLTDSTLVAGHSGRISPLWSLQWEVLFSFLLPLFVVLALLGSRYDGVKVVTLLALCALGSVWTNGPLTYLPMFGIGALTAARWTDLGEWTARWSAGWRPFWGCLLVVAVLLVCSRWELTALGVAPGTTTRLDVVAVPGVWLLVLAAGFCRPVRRMLEAPAAQWTGRISFSLYLVHEPIVLGARFLTRHHSPAVAIAAAVPVSLVVAVLFERLVESRFHRLAQRVGRRVQRRVEAAAPAWRTTS